MVSFPLRQNVLATYNFRRYDQFIRNGEEPEELMRKKWLTFDNKLVLEILVEACRPRTREQCAKECIMFLSVAIPQNAKKTYLAMCTRYPGHGVPMRIIQDLVAECPLCQKDRIPQTTIPHPTSIETLLHHTRFIGIDHVTITQQGVSQRSRLHHVV